MDMTVCVPRLPGVGETVIGSAFSIAGGGKGANQAVAAARLGASVSLVGRVGRDEFGRELARRYEAEGIDTSCLCWDEETPTGVALVMVDEDGENVIAVSPGSNSKLSVADGMAAKSRIADAHCLLVQLEIPLETVRTVVGLAHAHGVRVILNPAPAVALPSDISGKIDILTPNRTEAEVLSGTRVSTIDDAKRAGRLIQSQMGSDVVVTLGGQGAILVTRDSEGVVPPFPVVAVDSTGAGDAFNGALAFELGRSSPLDESVRFACAAAAIAVTRLGAQTSLPSYHEVASFLRGKE